jgi:hypothetical protein
MNDEEDDFEDDWPAEEADADEGSGADSFADDEDEDDDEDEGPVEVRTAVLTKREMLALLSVKTGARGGLLVRVDPRQPMPSAQTYEDGEAALRWFRRSLATSRRNGWEVVYAGEPLYG